MASWASSLTSAPDIDPSFSVDEATASPDIVAALATFNSQLPPSAAITVDTVLGSTQRTLSHMLDEVKWSRRPLFRNFGIAFEVRTLTKTPATMVPSVRCRPGRPQLPSGMCVAGGERTQRHHVQDLFFSWAQRAGPRPELERLGLLLPQHHDDAHNAGGRPADVYLPAFAGSPAAFDFAITAPQRQRPSLRRAARKVPLLLLLRRTFGTKSNTFTLSRPARLKGLPFWLWWLNVPAPGTQVLCRFSST